MNDTQEGLVLWNTHIQDESLLLEWDNSWLIRHPVEDKSAKYSTWHLVKLWYYRNADEEKKTPRQNQVFQNTASR